MVYYGTLDLKDEVKNVLDITDWSQFWISFWSSLFAGAIDGVFTGLVVGIMILVFQWRIDKRRFRHKSEREVATFREQIRLILDQPQTVYVNSIVNPFSIVEPLVKLLSKSPLDLWLDTVPKQEKLFSTIKEFQRVHSHFIIAANTLQTEVTSGIRHIHNKQGIINVNDGMLFTFFVGRTLGLDNEDIVPWVGLGGGNTQSLTSLEERYSLLQEKQEIKELTPPYLTVRRKLEEAINTLRTTLDEPVVPKQKSVIIILKKLYKKIEKPLHRRIK